MARLLAGFGSAMGAFFASGAWIDWTVAIGGGMVSILGSVFSSRAVKKLKRRY